MRDLLVKISQIESQCDESAVGAERKEAEKTQKKKFREIRKLVADGALTTEEKLQRLMEKCVQEVGACWISTSVHAEHFQLQTATESECGGPTVARWMPA